MEITSRRSTIHSLCREGSGAGLLAVFIRHKEFYRLLCAVCRRRWQPVIISIKDTSLFIVIGVAELTRQGRNYCRCNFRALEI